MVFRSTFHSQLLVLTQHQEEGFQIHLPQPRDFSFLSLEYNRLWFELPQSYFPNLAFSSKRKIKRNRSAPKNLLSELCSFQSLRRLKWKGWNYLPKLTFRTNFHKSYIKRLCSSGVKTYLFQQPYPSMNERKPFLRTGSVFLKGKS